MGRKDPRVDNYIEQSAEFARPILRHLRKVVHAGCPDVEETMKWSFPHFVHKGILCSMASFRGHCAFGFWKASLLAEPGKPLSSARGEAMGQFGRVTSIADLPAERTLIGYVRKAAALNEAGVRRPQPARPRKLRALEVPEDLAAALRRNRKAQATFDSFGMSHKREYVEWIVEAKRDETRKRRLDTAVAWLSEGKIRNWKYAAR